MLDLDELLQIARIEKHIRDLSFIACLHQASLDDGTGLTGNALTWLCNPPTKLLRIENPDIKLALETFLALGHSSEGTYKRIRNAIHG